MRARVASTGAGAGAGAGAGEDGAVLLIVLAFMAFMGMVIMAVLNFSDTSFRASTIMRDTDARLGAADGGIKFAIAQLVANPAVCGTTVGEGPVALPAAPPVNGFRAAVTCERRAATVFKDSIGWGLYLTDEAGQIAAVDDGLGGNDARRIEGPVYNHSTAAAPWDLQANLVVEDGMVLQRIADDGCNTAQDIRLVLRGTASFACTPPVAPPTVPVPTQPLPTSPELLGTRSADGDGGATCRVFEPGRYAEMPNLAPQNYFRSGSYLFEQGFGVADGVTVLGGMAPAVEQSVLGLAGSVPCAAGFVGVDGTGVQFIFAGGGSLVAQGGARVELHSAAKGDAAGTTIRQVQASDPAPWGAMASTLPAEYGSGLLRAAGGASLVVHGLVWAPTAAVDLNGQGGDVVQLLGGVVAAKVRLSSPGTMAEPGVRIAAGEPFQTEKYVVTATVPYEGGQPVEVRAVVRLPADDPDNPIIYSWNVLTKEGEQ
ncbi:MAG: hypothetical protein R2755_17035 [Acidimicrobiales bacterium]